MGIKYSTVAVVNGYEIKHKEGTKGGYQVILKPAPGKKCIVTKTLESAIECAKRH